MQVVPGEVVRKVHLSVLAVLFVAFAAIYYIEQIPGPSRALLRDTSLTSVHDLHRTLFLIPIIYAALVFRTRGAIVGGVLFLCVVLPRALYLSPYPYPLLRALISVASFFAIGLLVAAWRNRLEIERKDKEKLAAAYEDLKSYGKRLEENQLMLIQAEKLASMGQLAASIAHEVNNPLSGVLVYLQLMKKKILRGDGDPKIVLDYLSKIEAEITRSTRLIRNLLDFSSQSAPNFTEVDAKEVLERALDLAIHARSGPVRVEKDIQPVPKVMADADQLQEVLINIMVNGFQAMPSGGTLTVRMHPANGEVRIAIQDTGCGIPPENMAKLFTPFFSTKKEVKGVGLGLAVSYGIMQRLNGRIEVESRPGKGSTFTVCLPQHATGAKTTPL